MNVQFVSDAAGKPTAVLVPIKEWERIQQYLPGPAAPAAAHKKPGKKEQFKEDFREAVREMQLMQEGKLPKYPVRQFLAELDDEQL
ncbi:hypothetical protein [Hymenobacter baengnokdamensis]|uniref:hypothetical protein n=1 Tax=Hymenobacter baengnokdamensis TaxID=2615203 RepID=UPI0012474951|nr:hypothetical protein [Hymenobacter baengnokdamensis]